MQLPEPARACVVGHQKLGQSPNPEPLPPNPPCSYMSLRGHVWTDVDNNRAGGLPFVFDDNMSFER